MAKAPRDKTTPAISQDGRARRAERERRLAEALRANLRKRKRQLRAREAGAEAAGTPTTETRGKNGAGD